VDFLTLFIIYRLCKLRKIMSLFYGFASGWFWNTGV